MLAKEEIEESKGTKVLISQQPRDCERFCKECKEWKHFSRFRSYRRTDRRNSIISPAIGFSPTCRDCEQKKRNEKKNADRPLAIVEQRAKTAARKAGVTFNFFWENLNYRALVPYMRAMMTDEGVCLGCGHVFDNERDIQLDHTEPPRSKDDWARLHARNVRIACGSCNRTKGNKGFAEWLDEQEGSRLSNQKLRGFVGDIDDEEPHEIQIEAFHPDTLGKRPMLK